jgi:hypothetical protein
MRTILTLLACLMVAPLATGCSRSGEYCDLACQCESCSDRDYDECTIKYDASSDTADAYGCSDQFDQVHECVINNNDCIADNFAPEASCLDDIADLSKCIDKNSSL